MHTTRTTRALSAIALTGVLGLTAASCGDDTTTSTDTTSDSSSIDSGSQDPTTSHNDADIAFAADMIPHHAQALAMVELTDGRTLDPEVQQLAEAIRDAQSPEITTMTGWLTSWGQDVPDTSGSMDDMDSSMPGMMSSDEMSSLRDAPDADFQEQWLELMIQHHEGAVDMAKTEIDSGQYQPALDLATSIVESQSAEIDTMKAILG